jgi:hypothetical protein
MKHLIVLLLLLIVITGCSKVFYYQNHNYRYQGQSDYTIALIPLSKDIPTDMYAQMDTFYSTGFKSSNSTRNIVPSYHNAYSSTLDSSDMMTIVNKLRLFTINDYNNHLLSEIIDTAEINKLKAINNNIDFLIVPRIFHISSEYSTYGYYNFRCYDFKNGKLLYEQGNTIQIGACNNFVCTMQCGFFMLGMAEKDFNEYMKVHTN